MSSALVCLLTVGLCANALGAVSPNPPASSPQVPSSAPGAPVPRRDGGARATSTAGIRGRVIAADTGRPLRRAQVRTTSLDTRETRLTSTDGEGRYELKELPGGRYRVE